MINRMLALLLAGGLALAGAAGAAEAAAGAESWETRTEKALDAQASVEGWKDASLKDVLEVISKAAGVAVVLDPKAAPDADKVRITMSIPKDGGMTLRSVLGNVLKLAGLRYTLKDQAIFVSTRERLVGELLAADGGPAPYVPGVSGPMTAGDAIASTVDFFDGSEETLPQTILDFTRAPVDARFETPPYRDAQGRLNFPAPPMIIADPNLLNPIYRFDTQPYFLKPEYLAPLYWGPQSRPVGAEAASKIRDSEMLKALLEYMKKHPEQTVGQLMQQLEQIQTQNR